VERGRWLYLVLAEKGVALRTRCSFADAAKTSTRGPDKGTVIEVKERVRCGGTSFLRLTDGSGWVFDVKNGRKVLEQLGPKEAVEMSATGRVLAQPLVASSPKKQGAFSLNFTQLTSSTPRGSSKDVSDRSEGVYLRSAPTNDKWSLTKMLLLADQHVRVSLKLKLEEGNEWLRVSKLGGMEGWVPAGCIAMEEPQQQEWVRKFDAHRNGTRCGWKSFSGVENDQSFDSRVNSFENANPQGF